MKPIKIIIQFKSFNYKLLDQLIQKIFQKGNLIGLSCKGPIYLPNRKKLFTVLKSPHVNKTARDQFQLVTHKRLLIINYNLQNFAILKIFLDFIKSLSGGVQIKIKYITNNNWKQIN